MSTHLKDRSLPRLREDFVARGIPRYRADQVAGWLYHQGVEDPMQMTNLDTKLRRMLASEWRGRALDLEQLRESVDGTRKLLLRTHDGAAVEAVLIPEERRNTLCISTQVGCPLACSFCATGALGFTRNLTTAEIVDQVCRAREVLAAGAGAGDEVISNIVFMGMGEPLLNLPNVLEAIRLFTDPKAFGMAPRRITVSTVGVVPQIRPLLEVGPINLAVSLHAVRDEVRDVLVPINRKFPVRVLLDSLRNEELVSARRPVFFEYTLMKGVNDSVEDARLLPELLRGIPSKLNVIPMNPHPDAPYQPPDRDRIDRFTAALHEGGLRVTLRRNRGADIDAACGQLAARSVKPGPTPGS
jgi:23S rRNA (adenine2503-C2)-methyltransferase